MGCGAHMYGMGAHPCGMQGCGMQGCGAHAGGWHGGGAHMRLGAGGDRIELMTAEGMPMQVPQMLVQIPRMPPHMPNGDGGEHDGGAQG